MVLTTRYPRLAWKTAFHLMDSARSLTIPCSFLRGTMIILRVSSCTAVGYVRGSDKVNYRHADLFGRAARHVQSGLVIHVTRNDMLTG